MEDTRDMLISSTESMSTINANIDDERKAFRAKAAVMLDRGWTNARINVSIPKEDGVYGEWVHNSSVEIARMSNLGFKVDDKYATTNALHNDGTGHPVIGDVVFMTCPLWMHEDWTEMKKARSSLKLGAKQDEAPDFDTNLIGVQDKSVQEFKGQHGLAAAISADTAPPPIINQTNRQPNSWGGGNNWK